MPEPQTPYELIVAAGLEPANFRTVAWAPLVERESEEPLPALVTGRVGLIAAVFIRAWPTGEPGSWMSLAFVSKHPGLAFSQMEPEERERLRAESLRPAGVERPVGQERVIGRSDPVPIAPPLQPLDTAESVNADEEVADAILVVGECAECSGAVLEGPEGRQENHSEGCSRAT